METKLSDRLSTGIRGLDEILEGGLIPQRAYLVRGGPGNGKTTLGLYFLTAGVQQGEKVLFITLGEPEPQIRKNAQVMGFNLENVNFLDLSPQPEFFAKVEAYDIFSPAEVERVPTTQVIIDSIEKLKPQRIFVDAITQFRYLTADPFQFRKQVLSFLRFLIDNGATVLLTSEGSVQAPDDDLQFISDGVITLAFEQGARTVSVTKFRGSGFRSGRHTLKLTDRGIEVFPILLPEKYIREFTAGTVPSGVPELDEMLHGGLERGTSTLISGPSGVGKTTLGLQFMKEAAGRGERSMIYVFGEEMLATIIYRSESVNIPVRSMIEHGTLSIVRIEPLKVTPHEFASLVRREVEEMKTQLVMVDSIGGYCISLHGENLADNIHALEKYLVNMGVTLLLIDEMKNITGEFQVSEGSISYLVDNVLFLRYLEIDGELRKAIGVLKKRVSDFEKRLREFEITRYGIKVGKPLTGLRNILSGTPEWVKPPEEKG
ncbi:MAG: ATPase domain-containing protein [bacterium]